MINNQETFRYQAPLTDPKKYKDVLNILIELRKEKKFTGSIYQFHDTVVFTSQIKEEIDFLKKELLTQKLILEL